MECDQQQTFGCDEMCSVHNGGARLLGFSGRCCPLFICSLAVVFDNSWASHRREFVLLRELSKQRRVLPAEQGSLCWRFLDLPDGVQRLVIHYL